MGMLLVELTDDNGHLVRISTKQLALEHPWYGKIESIGPMRYSLDSPYGGYCKLDYGEISISPDTMPAWPPSAHLTQKAFYTDTTEAAAFELFSGNLYLGDPGIAGEELHYELFGKAYDLDLLEKIVDFEGKEVDRPICFGPVEYVPPVRVENVDGMYTYHKEGLTTGFQVQINGYPVESIDRGTTFSLPYRPAGDVTMSGSNDLDNLSAVCAWASVRLGLSLDKDRAGTPSPSIGFRADRQMDILSFLDELAAFYTHLIHLRQEELVLVDMFHRAAEPRKIPAFFIPANYPMHPPVKQFKADWTKRESGEWSSLADPSLTTGHYVREIPDQETLPGWSFARDVITVPPYTQDRDVIRTSLGNIKTILNAPIARLKIPMEAPLPIPGETLTWIDEKQHLPLKAIFTVVSVTYDWVNQKVELEAWGSLTSI